MRAHAINTIHRRPDPSKPVEVVAPGEMFDCSKTEFEELKAAGAARAAAEPEPETPKQRGRPRKSETQPASTDGSELV